MFEHEPPPSPLLDRVRALEGLARGLTPGDVIALGAAVRRADRDRSWPARDAFHLVSGYGISLSKEEKDALDLLWIRIQVALASVLGEPDVEAPSEGRGLVAWLTGSSPEERAGYAIERWAGGDGWAAMLAVWNAFCAALLRERLEPRTRTDLQLIWRTVIGTPLDC